ncbi:CidA/LrgA family protein [Macromonas nakdongensis]|uniref:CidA/LrgA family protein n=1 Tax=Macromonas nakdongensis TaxID=1843082 RepID=UPI0012FEE4B5|nr:CidA/LrgA family protein [Macromonas nakdongensis]
MFTLVVFECLGAMLTAKLGLGLPGSVIGFVLLALALGVFRDVPEALQRPSAWLLSHLPLFLIPALFSAVVALNLDHSPWQFLVLGCVGGTLVSALGAAMLVLRLQRQSTKRPVDD